MSRLAALVLGAMVIFLIVQSSVQGGAKGGKMRWSLEKSSKVRWEKAIVMPPYKDKKPGVVSLKIVYKAKELAEFFVIGDGASDLDLYVRDAKGKLIVQDEDPTASQGGGSDLCVCRWRPEEESEYTILIVNRDAVENVVLAGTN